MRLLAVLAHPSPTGFAASVLGAVRDGAAAGNHGLRVIDLAQEGFDPVLDADEWSARGNPGTLPSDLVPHVDALRWAEGLILVHPTWWGGPPAILKGWLDRVWRPGIAFDVDPGGALRPGLPGLRLIGVATTLGGSRWAYALAGSPGRRTLLRSLKVCTGLRTRTLWLALDRMEARDDGERRAFLDRVRARIAALR